MASLVGAVVLLAATPSAAQPPGGCQDVPAHAQVQKALAAAQAESNGGLGFHMWAAIVDRDGIVCAVVHTGGDRGDQWPGSRVISAQKANTANAFSLPKFALSTANLFSAVQPGGSLFGLQHSNPVDTAAAYAGPAARYGTTTDPLRGKRIGGVNVFGGGLALYSTAGRLLGAIGVSGDTSCADHIIAWKTRHALNLDNVPAGVAGDGKDNIIHDVAVDSGTGHTVSKGGFGHPGCSAESTKIANALPTSHPTGAAR
ncbi:MAG TPA: heme-binding protein [Vicinamibacterales bacterium]|nr:heme-binding protein [Vicinamibacterales bacterium]